MQFTEGIIFTTFLIYFFTVFLCFISQLLLSSIQMDFHISGCITDLHKGDTHYFLALQGHKQKAMEIQFSKLLLLNFEKLTLSMIQTSALTCSKQKMKAVFSMRILFMCTGRFHGRLCFTNDYCITV